MTYFDLPYKDIIDKDKTILYTNARIIDPESGFDQIGELLTIGSKIADFGKKIINNKIQNNTTIIDCNGHVLCPGLIDIQVHFRDPGQLHKEDLSSGSKSAVAGGVTTVVCQPNTTPVLDSADMINSLYKKARQTAHCNITAYGAITKNMEGKELTDMASMKKAGAVGFTDDGLPVMNAHIMRKAMELSKVLNCPIAQHAEDLNLSNKGCINEGETSVKLGVKGIPNISESVIVKRDLEILKLTGGHYHLLHVSTTEALDAVIDAKKSGLKATVEVCPHHFALNDTQVLKSGTNAKMNPPLRSEKDRLNLIEGLKNNQIDAISTDHAPHDLSSKDKPLQNAAFGIVGVETLLPISLELYHNKTLTLIDLLSKMTNKAADIINLDSGRIKKGSRADLTIIDLDKEWTIDSEKFYSKSKNSPFSTRKVKGRAIKTVVAGKLVYSI
jgi:dihydroorotase